MIRLTKELKDKIIKNLMSIKPDKIILFGSYAYGEPNKNSDLDILIIKDYKNKWLEKTKIRKLLDFINLPIDIMLEKHDFFKSHSGIE